MRKGFKNLEDVSQLNSGGHILKHYLKKQEDEELELLRFGIRIKGLKKSGIFH